MIRKIISGFLIQNFDDDGTYLDQSFCEVHEDLVQYEDENGEILDEYDIPTLQYVAHIK